MALVPIGMALANRVGFAPGSNGRIGIAVLLALIDGVCEGETGGERAPTPIRDARTGEVLRP